MQIERRPYCGETDKQRIAALVHASAADNLHVTDLPYRLSSQAFDLPANVGLWVDETEQLIAWAVMQTPMWGIEYAHLTALDPFMMHEYILSWADSRAREAAVTPDGHPMWFINVRDDQHERIQALEAAGFACQAHVPTNPWRKVFLQHAGQSALAPCRRFLPEITIRPLAGQGEVEACVQLHRAAFGSNNMTPEWRSRVLQRSEYIPDLDLIAVTPSGMLVAFCVGWLSRHGTQGTLCGQIEPMGVHPDFQHQGLGTAIITAALQRLYTYGAAEVYVEADETEGGAFDFYQSIGFQVAHRVLVYRKDYGDVR